MSICPICGESQNADETAFAYHVNSHFEAGPSTPSLRQSDQGTKTERDEDHASLEEACPICDFPLSFISPTEAQNHVNSCLDGRSPAIETQVQQNKSFDQDQGMDDENDYDFTEDFSVNNATSLQSNRNKNNEAEDEGWDGPARPGGWMDWAGRKVDKGDQWWDPIYGSTTDIPSNFSPGVIPILAQTLRTASHQGITRQAVLCRDVVHIKGIWRFDMGWGCGYRNALMSLSSILSVSEYQPIFDRQSNGSDPGVRRVQGWIQEAWEAGHDPEGKRQLKGKILGTKKWIGPSDLYAMFTYKGIPCKLYDFPKPKDPKDGSRTAHIALQKWVKAYFSEETPAKQGQPNESAFDILMRTSDEGAGRGEVVRISKKFPLILQHSGHSRTIIGYEENARGDINLLLFDPGRSMPKDIRSLAISKLSRNVEQAIQHKRQSSASSASTSRPKISKKRSSSISETHEPRPFSPPFTNGRAEIDYSSMSISAIDNQTSTNELHFMKNEETLHTRGGIQTSNSQSIPIEEDEEVTSTGWVRKKLTKKLQSKLENDIGGEVKGEESLDILKTLNYFRINLSNLSKHTEYQILAFEHPSVVLGREEKEKRKIITSTTVRA
ncbi:uncharacterized protein L201_006564 [Kwoniella dendrophila CBS 6074]|uniref:UFSP1/2/DUB catalytic domain-containing protein n=1 Tax=Kwoniella dendrophila CBS 6074 TaxID=1295534 RepID=A0AAX4K4F6_9TREE